MIYCIDFGSSKTKYIAAMLIELGMDCTVVPWQETDSSLSTKASGLILSGAPVLITETSVDPQLRAISFLRNIHLPVLGICFGHQLIGLLHGASACKGVPVREETIIQLETNDALFSGFEKSIRMVEDHTEGITIPKNFIKLASSEHYAVEAMKHETLSTYGVQFHPEVSGENGKRLFSNFCKLI